MDLGEIIIEEFGVYVTEMDQTRIFEVTGMDIENNWEESWIPSDDLEDAFVCMACKLAVNK